MSRHQDTTSSEGHQGRIQGRKREGSRKDENGTYLKNQRRVPEAR